MNALEPSTEYEFRLILVKDISSCLLLQNVSASEVLTTIINGVPPDGEGSFSREKNLFIFKSVSAFIRGSGRFEGKI